MSLRDLTCLTYNPQVNLYTLLAFSMCISLHTPNQHFPRKREKAEGSKSARASGRAARLSPVERSTRSRSTMRLTCVACRVSLVSEAREADASGPLAHGQLARCGDCGGLFHTACSSLATRDKAKPFMCARCAGGESRAQTPLPLLVPEEALAFLGDEAHASEDDESDDDDEWRVLAQDVDVCTRCRQLRVEETATRACGGCQRTTFHIGCGTLLAVGGKRKRPLIAATLSECASCADAENAPGGVIASRRVCGLTRRDESNDAREWWASTCVRCERSFCLEEFANGEASDADLEAVRGATVAGQDGEDAWMCAACVVQEEAKIDDPMSSRKRSAGADHSPSSSSCGVCKSAGDASRLAAQGGSLACATCSNTHTAAQPAAEGSEEPQELMTVLICDGCESEFDFATLIPPLTEIPDGDWFCSACSGTLQPSTSTAAAATSATATEAATLPMVSVTVLICDGCDGEFEMEALNIPLSAIPEGDWFCPHCEALKKSQAKAKNRRNKKGKRAAASVTPPAPMVMDAVPVELVTVLICDGCDGEFDAALLNPPLKEIPQGDWFCGTCSASRSGSVRRRSGKSAQQTPLPATSTLPPVSQVRMQGDGGANTLDDDNFEMADAILENDQPGNPRAPRKRKRSIGYQGKRRGKPVKRSVEELPSAIPIGAVETDTVEFEANIPGIRIPQPVASTSSGKQNDAVGANGHLSVLVSDDDGDEPEDEADDGVVIVCDMCLADFNMIDIVGNAAKTVPPRPWYCNSCVRSLKRTRKKRQRFSKQMLMEMQLYGELLRPTSAKAYDVKAAALRGKPPKTSIELKTLFELVGRRVGIYLKWDKHWVMGRVLSFEVGHPSFHHIVRFEDGVEKSLPLYAFPLVIGTRSLVYVKVPTLQNQWWPGQLLRLNPLAKKLLLPDEECASAVANYRLVSIYASSDCKGKTQNVSCWVPKHLCRSLTRFSPRAVESLTDDLDGPQVGSSDFKMSFKRALSEPGSEEEVLKVAFQRLLQHVRRQGDDQWQEFGRALVGLELVDTLQADQGSSIVATRFDTETSALVVESESSQGSHSVDLRSDERRFFLRKSSDFAEIAVRFSSTSIAEAENQQQDATRAALDAAISSMPINHEEMKSRGETTSDSGETSCAVCLLPAEAAFEGSVDEAKEALVECVKCTQSFHLACCDPPHDPTPLLNEDDGSAILEDVKSAFVCSKCTTCVGCSKRFDAHRDSAGEGSAESTEPSWSQWRLPLQVAALCSACVPYYQAKQYCTVCLEVLSDDAVVTSINLHSCSTCHQWIHTACEPDPHAALLACTNSAEFELDVQLELPGVPASLASLGLKTIGQSTSNGVVKVAAPEAQARESTSSVVSGDGDNESKPIRLAEEEFAFGLKFKDTYDPKALNKYECLSCRKVRMLQVIHRLKAEDKLELFKEPVTKAIAPTYFDVIKEPMDLSTMQKKVLENAYTRVNFRDIRDDFELMCLNAVTFNSKERDFLIWREAWRFYGQGQRILRQTAPKSRMKHRGGKYHDALVAAAKRQLPNNSAFGKSGFEPGEDAFPGSTHGDNDDDIDMSEERADSAKDRAGAQEPVNGVLSADSKAVQVSASSTNGDHSHIKTENGASSSDLPGVAATPLANGSSSSFAAPAAERKAQATETAVVLQSELGETPKPHSAVQVFKMVQARATAHTYAWLDMCLACGSAGMAKEMIFCVDCGEGFHSFCVPGMKSEQLDESDYLQTFWRCQNCKMCEVCGQPGGDDSELYFCGCCESGFHGSCLVPAIKKSSDDDSFGGDSRDRSAQIYCSSCVKCQECGREQQEMSYSYDPDNCLSCSQTKKFEATLKREKSKPLAQIWITDARTQKKDSEKCPMCKLNWTAEDEELIQCDACELWAHPNCDSLLTKEPERYKKLVEDSSALYICEVCRPKEREHLSGVPNVWKCQILIEMIQQKRDQTDATWKEAREQLEQAKQWKFWRDHTPVYLYILRLGEECLKNLAFRSVNFRTNWSRFTKEQELANSGVVLPSWLVQKASRYLRFKRYARGPRAALRRQDRKANNFYSRHGVEKQKDVSIISTIVSEACSCAALLACVHLFYGWRPLPKVALHLLSGDAAKEQGHERLSEVIVKMLSHGGVEMSLEDEIAMIERQYERRVGKKPVVRDQNDASDSNVREHSTGESAQKMSPSSGRASVSKEHADSIASDAKPAAVSTPALTALAPTAAASASSLTGSSDAAPVTGTEAAGSSDTGSASPTGSPTPGTTSASKSTEPVTTAASTEPEAAAPAPATDLTASTTPATSSPISPGSELVLTSSAPKRSVKMTKATALSGWPSAEVSDNAIEDAPTAIQVTNPSSVRPKFVDNRFCAFCFMIGDDLICGRLIYTDREQWVHVNCAMWSVEVFESAEGVLQKCQKAKNRSRLIRCDACGVLGASVGCAVYRCQRHYHFPCAYDSGVAFLPNGDTVCPKPDHIATISRKQKLAITPKTAAITDTSVGAVTQAADRSAEVAISTAPSGVGNTEEVENSVAQAHEPESAKKTSELTPAEIRADNQASENPNGGEQDQVMTETGVQEVTGVSATDASTASSSLYSDEKREKASGAAPQVSEDAAAEQQTSTATAPATTGSSDNSNARRLEIKEERPTPVAVKHPATGAPVLSVVDPSPEPRRHLRSDLPIVVSDLKKQGSKSRRTKRTQCIRLGALTVQSFGHIVVGNPSFHSRDAIYPLGYRSTRIYWSTTSRATRCLYECVVTSTDIEERMKSRKRKDRDDSDHDSRAPARAVFKIVASDDRERPIVTFSAEDAVTELRNRVAALYEDPHCFGVLADKNPFMTRTSWASYGLSSAHFFGFGIPAVAKEIEQLPHAATTSINRQIISKNLAKAGAGSRKRRFDSIDNVAAGDAGESNSKNEVYVFTQHLPTPKQFEDALREVEQLVVAEERARLSSGSSRTDGHEGYLVHEGDAPRVAPLRRRLNKQASREPETQLTATVASSNNANANAPNTGNSTTGAATGGANTKSSSGVPMDLEHLPIAMQYRELRRRPFDERLEVRKSKIHGYGLFTKEKMAEGQMIVEYQGQMIAQDVADEREKQYEEMGIGSCYMFRLDEKTIIDATRVGNLARFINHSCDPKAYARVVVVEGNEKKIVIFAKRAIEAGDEVTYDYKFPIEDEAIRCDCSAPNCIGRMN